MSILTADQKSALYGRLLGLAPATSASGNANAPERSAPSGTRAGTEPLLLGSLTQNRVLLYVGAGLALLGVIYVARKVL